GPRVPVVRRGRRARARPPRHPVRRHPHPGRRPAGGPAGRHRRRRGADHHDHPRPRRPGSLLRAARPGVAAPRHPADRGRVMRFQVLDIVPHTPHPVTGQIISVHERLRRVVETAVLAERLGFDSYAVGERHAGQFVSSAPTVLLGAIAQATQRILLSTGVTVLSLHDPVRVAEDYTTIDQLSGGRLEIVIGKGNEDKHFPLFGLHIEHQYDYLVENYELLRRLLREEDVSWRGTHRAGLDGATTHPRPFDGPFRIWYGSATSTAAVDLAAKWGD